MRAEPGLLRRAPGFAALLTARAVSLLGDGVGALALVIHVQRTAGTGQAVGLLLLVASLPNLLAPLTGTLADRVDRRTVLIAAELLQGVVLGVVLLWMPPLPLLLGLLLLKATLVTIADPAGRSAIPALVEDEDLDAANALLGGLRQAGEVLGPLLGGAVVAAFGVRAGLAIDAATFAVSVPLLLRLAPMPPAPETGPGVLAEAVEGLRFTLAHPVARALGLGFLIVGLSSADDVALPFLAMELGAGEPGVGALYAAVGAGLIVGYLALTRLGSRLPTRAGLLLGAAVAGLGNLATGLPSSIAAAVGFQVVRGVGLAFYDTGLQTLIQRTVPAAHLGRVFANVFGAVNVTAALGLLLGGPLLDATSPRAVLIGVGAVGLLGAAVTAALLPREG
ncbi:MAG: MFS transporter [Alphaproteobacteria bacterium]|nr:MFS transporter [Alphaproteobacteria bacterium]